MESNRPKPLHPYTVVLDYYATGEGVTQQIAVLMAESAEEAKEKFLTAHGYEGKGRDYFRVGVEAIQGIDADVLGQMLTPQFIATLERRVRHGMFTLSWHFNAS